MSGDHKWSRSQILSYDDDYESHQKCRRCIKHNHVHLAECAVLFGALTGNDDSSLRISIKRLCSDVAKIQFKNDHMFKNTISQSSASLLTQHECRTKDLERTRCHRMLSTPFIFHFGAYLFRSGTHLRCYRMFALTLFFFSLDIFPFAVCRPAELFSFYTVAVSVCLFPNFGQHNKRRNESLKQTKIVSWKLNYECAQTETERACVRNVSSFAQQIFAWKTKSHFSFIVHSIQIALYFRSRRVWHYLYFCDRFHCLLLFCIRETHTEN